MLSKLCLLGFVIGYWGCVFINFDVAINNSMASLWIHVPTMVAANEAFNITVEAWDKYERLAGEYRGQVAFTIESYNTSTLLPLSGTSWTVASNATSFTSNFNGAGVVPAYMVSGADNGRKQFLASIATPGLHYVNCHDMDKHVMFRSNPILVMPASASFNRSYWGDIHFHSGISDGSGTPSELYGYARDVALVDFAALTDHAEMFPRLGGSDLFNTFQSYIETTNSFNQDGKFATLVAMEWTPLLSQARSYMCSEHINVYFRGDIMPFFSTFDETTPDDLFTYLASARAGNFLAWTHHVTRSDYPADWGFYNATINTMAEIYSCHGSGEFQGSDNLYKMVNGIDQDHPGYCINDALRMGRKIGIMASSDCHDGHPGHDLLQTNARVLNQYPYSFSGYRYGVVQPGGLTCIIAANLTRTSVFDALQHRAAYATTWVNRHVMEFRINDVPVGTNDSTVVVPDVTSMRAIDIFLACDGISRDANKVITITNVTIFKNSVPWRSIAPGNVTLRWHATDTAKITGTSYDDCVKKADGHWYVSEHSINPVDPATLNTHGNDYYYVRMTDSNGGAGWIGPIWVQVQ